MASLQQRSTLQRAEGAERPLTAPQDELIEISIQDNGPTCPTTQSKTAFTAPSAAQIGSGTTETTITREKRIFAGVPRAPRLQFPVWALSLLVSALMIVLCAQAVGWGRWTGADRTAPPPMFVSGPPPPYFPETSPMWKGPPYDYVQTPLWHVLLAVFGAIFLVHSIVISVSARAIIGRGAMLPMKHDRSVEPKWRAWVRNSGNLAGVVSSLFFMAAGAVSSKFQSHPALLATALSFMWLWGFTYTLVVATANLEVAADTVNAVVMGIASAVMCFSAVFTTVMYSFGVYGSTSVCAMVCAGSAAIHMAGIAWNNRRENVIIVTEFGTF